MQYLLLILGGVLGGLFMKDNMDAAIKGCVIVMILFVLYVWGSQHP
jgi:hypothetical protein